MNSRKRFKKKKRWLYSKLLEAYHGRGVNRGPIHLSKKPFNFLYLKKSFLQWNIGRVYVLRVWSLKRDAGKKVRYILWCENSVSATPNNAKTASVEFIDKRDAEFFFTKFYRATWRISFNFLERYSFIYVKEIWKKVKIVLDDEEILTNRRWGEAHEILKKKNALKILCCFFFQGMGHAAVYTYVFAYIVI